MQEFIKFNFEGDNFNHVVFIASIEDIYYLQDEIFNTLSKDIGEEFSVLIDLFMRNGFSFNRYCSLKFKGKENCEYTLINPREVSENIKKEVKTYLYKNPNILEDCALSKNTVNFMLNSCS